MRFNKHFNLAGKHAALSASKNAWLNYDDEKLDDWFLNAMAAQRGTELHDLAARMIKLGIRAQSTHKTLNMYVNESIGFKMKPEQTLYVSDNCYGTADGICFRRGKLRISDLKTGLKETGERQLLVYAAMFCLEYGIKPFDIEIELRIYQNDDVRFCDPDPDEIAHIMDRILTIDKRLNMLKAEADD